jgi:hypothetical protein
VGGTGYKEKKSTPLNFFLQGGSSTALQLYTLKNVSV